MKKNLIKGFNIFITLVLVVGILYMPNLLGLVSKAYAAGIVLSASSTELTTGGDVTFTWTASTAVEAIGTTYTFTITPALGTALVDCTSADGFADSNGTNGAGAFSGFSTSNAVFTLTTATVTTGRSLCIKFGNETIQSYSVSMVSSTGDFGAVMIHYDDNNDVTVTANVAPTLSFNIRDLGDTTDTNVCDLGTVTTLTAPNLDAVDDGVGECGYSIAVGTNANSGFQVQITSDGALRTVSHNMTAVVNDASFSAGTEAYGLANVTAGTSITENGNFAADSTPVPASPTNFVSTTAPYLYTAGGGATDVTKVVHGLAIGSSTPTGAYAELVTYSVTATF